MYSVMGIGQFKAEEIKYHRIPQICPLFCMLVSGEKGEGAYMCGIVIVLRDDHYRSTDHCVDMQSLLLLAV